MTGEKVRAKIRAKGFTFHSIAQAIGESDANFRCLLLANDVKSGTLERIAVAMGENVAYFYCEQPIFKIVDYIEYEVTKRENELLKQTINDKDEVIKALKNKD
ncbi:MAG: hypothetical protein RR037_03330 [Alistipes sp.]